MENSKSNIARDLLIIILSIAIAIILVKTGILDKMLIGLQEWKFLGIILAGALFVSIFTAVPAGVVLFEAAAAGSVWEVALFGAIGALIGDFLIFRFVKNNLVESVKSLISQARRERIISIFELKIFRWLFPFFGALIVASPLPDEIGLAMMGFAKMETKFFIPISFFLNFIGILILGLLAK
jgi:hypothetical protein